MAGLFDTLSLGSRSLSTYRKAIDTTGHNLSNVSTPGYARQRVEISSVTTSTDSGSVGAGSEATRIVSIRNEFASRQLQVESSVQGGLESKQDALQQTLTALQETISRNGDSGTSTGGISQGLSEFFAAVQSLSTDVASLPSRTVVLQKSQELANKFNQVDARLGGVQDGLNKQISAGASQVNDLATQIAGLNKAIASEEALNPGSANDLRDQRQLKLEELSRLVKIDSAEQENGSINISISGTTLVDGGDVANKLESFDAGGGKLQLRAAGQVQALALTGGSIQGAISVRDNEVADTRKQINDLAASFIAAVNQVHATGFNLNGGNGQDFFTGTDAATIRVNSALAGNPALIQASAAADAKGDNTVILKIAQLGSTAQSALGGQTFSSKQAQTVASAGQHLASAKSDLEDQKAITQFVQNQRDSVSGVSVDEEMSNLMLFQKAFQASARLISMTDELLSTIIQM